MSKYWETEAPEVLEAGKNVIKVYPQAGKVQMFLRLKDSPTGLSKGVTLDLASMTVQELTEAKERLTKIMGRWAELKGAVQQ